MNDIVCNVVVNIVKVNAARGPASTRRALHPAHGPALRPGIQRALMCVREGERVCVITDCVRKRVCVPAWTVGTSDLPLQRYSTTAQYC